MLYGTLKWFNTRKGYGFITNQDNGKDVFVHITQLRFHCPSGRCNL